MDQVNKKQTLITRIKQIHNIQEAKRSRGENQSPLSCYRRTEFSKYLWSRNLYRRRERRVRLVRKSCKSDWTENESWAAVSISFLASFTRIIRYTLILMEFCHVSYASFLRVGINPNRIRIKQLKDTRHYTPREEEVVLCRHCHNLTHHHHPFRFSSTVFNRPHMAH